MMRTDGTTDGTPLGTIVFDLDGVVYVDSHAVPGAGEALRAIADAGWHIVFATNNSTRSATTVLEHIEQRTGFRSPTADVVTSAMAAAGLAREAHERVFVVGEPGLRQTLENAGLTVVEDATPDCVIVGLDRDISYGKIDVASRLIRDGAAFIATNTDATFPTQTGAAPGAGSIVSAIATASGIDPVACGKPHVPMLAMVREKIRGDSVWVVGDRPETDLALARRAGWKAVLVLSGVTTSTTPIKPDHAPHHTLQSIADLPALLSM
ncbi:MAG: HAD-IIA family hydrolase [Actinomycetota bacterium]